MSSTDEGYLALRALLKDARERGRALGHPLSLFHPVLPADETALLAWLGPTLAEDGARMVVVGWARKGVRDAAPPDIDSVDARDGSTAFLGEYDETDAVFVFRDPEAVSSSARARWFCDVVDDVAGSKRFGLVGDVSTRRGHVLVLLFAPQAPTIHDGADELRTRTATAGGNLVDLQQGRLAAEACLVVVHSGTLQLATRFDLAPSAPTIIGRQSGSTIHVDSDRVSRAHARIERRTRWWLTDLGSKNGTLLGGREIKEAVLEPGALVKIGDTVFKFLSGAGLEAEFLEQVYRCMVVDGLTGLENARAIEERLDRELRRAARHGRSLSLLLADIDGLTRVNETHGHEAGDELVRVLAREVEHRLRRRDAAIGRLATGPILALLPERDAVDAAADAEEIRAGFSRPRLADAGAEATVSVAVSTVTGASEPARVLATLHETLQSAKSAGRDRVAIASSTAASHALGSVRALVERARGKAQAVVAIAPALVDASGSPRSATDQRAILERLASDVSAYVADAAFVRLETAGIVLVAAPAGAMHNLRTLVADRGTLVAVEMTDETEPGALVQQAVLASRAHASATAGPTRVEAYLGDAPFAFISYSHRDAVRADAVLGRLARAGVRFWYDAGIPAASDWAAVIEERLKSCAVFVVLVSPDALASENVVDEIHFARSARKPTVAVVLEDGPLAAGLELRLARFQRIDAAREDLAAQVMAAFPRTGAAI